ncbi:MAG: endo alpha-1,4 polygalactosaminidase [Candidatus Scalindua sp.]|nr:endo alpha-1,4 polygalactosaminidase [Candidatus Scalindua sp.]
MQLLKKTIPLVFTVCFIAVISSQETKARDTFGFYYGNTYSDQWNNYENLVIDIRNYSPENDFTDLLHTSARLITYLSIGETDSLIEGDKLGPGGYASWYLDYNNDNLPDRNPVWGSYYVNANSNAWHDYILQTLIPEISPGGIRGLFLDTIDTVDIYPETTQGMIALVIKIRLNYPDCYLVQNRGFSVINETAGSINAVLFEEFSSYYDFDTGEYKKWTGSELSYLDQTGSVLSQLKRYYPIDIWTLDYRPENDIDLLKFAIERAAMFGFSPSTTDIYVTRLDQMNLFSISDELDSTTDRAVDIREFRVETRNNALQYHLTMDGNIVENSNHYQIFITTLKPDDPVYFTSTGFCANYMVEDNSLYKYNGTGTSWSWTYIGDVRNSIQNNTITTEIFPASLGTGNNTLVTAMAVSSNSIWAPQDTSDILRGVTEIVQTDAIYQIEDDIDKSIKGHQDIKRLTSTDSTTELIVEMVLRSQPNGSNHYVIFLDTDGVHSGYRNYEITASHIVMDGQLYIYSGDGDTWNWNYLKPVSVVSGRKQLLYTLEKQDIELGTGEYRIMGEVLDSQWRVTDYTGMLECTTNF